MPGNEALHSIPKGLTGKKGSEVGRAHSSPQQHVFRIPLIGVHSERSIPVGPTRCGPDGSGGPAPSGSVPRRMCHAVASRAAHRRNNLLPFYSTDPSMEFMVRPSPPHVVHGNIVETDGTLHSWRIISPGCGRFLCPVRCRQSLLFPLPRIPASRGRALCPCITGFVPTPPENRSYRSPTPNPDW